MTANQANIDKHLRSIISQAKAARIALGLGLEVHSHLNRMGDALQAATSEAILLEYAQVAASQREDVR